MVTKERCPENPSFLLQIAENGTFKVHQSPAGDPPICLSWFGHLCAQETALCSPYD